MIDYIFPDLSGQDQKYYKEKRENPAVGPKSENGYEFTRPRSTRRPRRVFTTGFTAISQAEKEELDAFWDDMHGGSVIFQWKNPITGEMIAVRFPIGFDLDWSYEEFRATPAGKPDHRFSVQIQLKEA